MRWPLLLTVVSAVWADSCQREFFAQPVIYDRAMAIDFYYTAINLPSVAACAGFCGDRHFCRTAVYNIFAKTCAISYEYTLNCRYNDKRIKEFDTKNSTSNLIQIACVTKCNEASRIARKQKISTEPEESPSTPVTLKKVDIITGEPNDGVRLSPQKLARARPPGAMSDFSDPGFINKLIIENFTSILPVLDSHNVVRRRGQVCYRLRERKFLLGAVFQTHKNVELASCRCMCAATYEKMDGSPICKSFNWRVDGTCELNSGNDQGKFDLIDDNRYTYQFVDCDANVLMNVGRRFCKNGKAITVLPTTTTTTEPTTTSEVIEETTTIEGSAEESTTSETEETPTLRAQRRQGIVTDEGTSTTEELTSTTNTEERTTTEEASTTSTEEETTVRTTTAAATEEATTIVETTVATTTEEPTTTTAEETTTTLKPVTTTEEPTTTTVEETTKASEEPTTDTEHTTTVTESTTSETTEAPTTTEATTTEETTTALSLSIEHSECFERIPRYMMISFAAALEHDVSLEECECFCANSRNSGRHGFDCASATYYHGERDCVLNIEDRLQKPKFFSTQAAEFNVTYLGLTCPREKAIARLVDKEKTYGCRAAKKTHETRKNKNKGAFSDDCFVELPSYILEGTALHVETNATPQQCKCLCAAAEHKFGEACQSFQYYYEGSTCLLSKHNRFSSPENFNLITNSQPRSYFEYKCASKQEKLKKYAESYCDIDIKSEDPPSEKSKNSIQDDQWLSSKEEGSAERSTKSSTQTTTTSAESTTTEKATETTTEATTVTSPETTTVSTTTTSKPKKRRVKINRWIPETEGLKESDFDGLESDLADQLEDPTPALARAKGVKTHKFTDKVEKAAMEDPTTTTLMTASTISDATEAVTTTTSSTTTTESTTTAEPSTTTTKATTTTAKSTTTTPAASTYPPAGKCTYSALYQTAFFGRRILKTVMVKSAADCFAACFALHCRSANLIAQGALNQCELFRDSLIDYRRPDMIGYDGSTVYFDGIRCDGV